MFTTMCGTLGDVHLLPAEGADRRVIDENRVCAAVGSPDADTVQEWSERFGLLSDPARLSPLLCIGAAGPIRVTGLAVAVDQNPDTVSRTLRLLRASHPVSPQRDGRVIRYRLVDPTIGHLLDLAAAPATTNGK